MKARLSQLEFEEVLSCIEEIYRCRSLEEFPHELLVSLNKLISCDVSGYNEVNLRRNRTIMVLEPPQGPEFMQHQAGFQNHIAEHPLVTYMHGTGDGQALMISDFLNAREFQRLALYRECYRRIGVKDQMAMGVRMEDGFVIGIAFNRGTRSFSEKDRLRLNMVRPHVIQAYFLAQERAGFLDHLSDLQKVLGEVGRGLIAVSGNGEVVHVTPGAFECLARYVAVPDTDEPILPPALAKWAQEKGGLSERIILPGNSSRLTVRRVPQSGRVLLLLSEESELPDSQALARYQLTPRELEVLRWLAEGKSNPEIATILGLTAGTAKLHVERILTKLGVENRTAAARIVHGAA